MTLHWNPYVLVYEGLRLRNQIRLWSARKSCRTSRKTFRKTSFLQWNLDPFLSVDGKFLRPVGIFTYKIKLIKHYWTLKLQKYHVTPSRSIKYSSKHTLHHLPLYRFIRKSAGLLLQIHVVDQASGQRLCRSPAGCSTGGQFISLYWTNCFLRIRPGHSPSLVLLL